MNKKEVEQIVMNVHKGYRTKKELKACGCDNCEEALMTLRGAVGG